MRVRGGSCQCRAIAMVMVFLQLVPLPVFSSNPPNSGLRVGVNKTGRWKAEQDAAYPVLVKRIQKWIENLDPIDVQVSESFTAVHKASLVNEQIRRDLSLSSEKLRAEFLSGNHRESLSYQLREMIESRKKASGESDLGPEIQKSLMIEAAYYWQQGELSKSRSGVKRAIKIHPNGLVPSIIEWDNVHSSRFNSEAFDTFVAQIKSQESRDCVIRFLLAPEFSLIKINGFIIKDTKEIALSSKVSHHLEVSATGFQSERSLISCMKPENKKITVQLRPLRELAESIKPSIGSKESTKSVILVEPVQDRFKLFLYSPGHEIDEIPLSHPLRLADLDSSVDSMTGPIATDAAVAIFEKHKQLTLNLEVSDGDRDIISNQIKQSAGRGPSNKSWLESPVFWGIVGGVLIGGAITYFATQNKTSSNINSRWE